MERAEGGQIHCLPSSKLARKEIEQGESMEKVNRNKRKNRKIFFAFCILLLSVICMGGLRTEAEENKIPLNLEIENDIGLKAGTDKNIGQDIPFVFEIIPEEAKNPVPPTREVKIIGAGKAAFKTIYFTTPGNYKYIIRQKTEGNKNWNLDNREYRVNVSVKKAENNRLSLSVWGFIKGSDEKTDVFQFKNLYRGKTGTPHPIKTGDESHAEPAILVLLGAGAVITYIIAKRKH